MAKLQKVIENNIINFPKQMMIVIIKNDSNQVAIIVNLCLKTLFWINKAVSLF